MIIGEKIRKIREENDLSINKCAHLIQVSPGNLSDIEKGRNFPSMTFLVRFSETFDISLNWLLREQGGKFMLPENMEILHEFYRLPVWGKISCGPGTSLAVEEPIDDMFFPRKEIGPRPDHYLVLEAQGDSMEGGKTDIRNGDRVLIEECHSWHRAHNRIAAVRIEDEIVLKRVFVDKKKKIIMLISENPSYSPLIIPDNEAETSRLIGVAARIIREL